jgi:hypothetical protein
LPKKPSNKTLLKHYLYCITLLLLTASGFSQVDLRESDIKISLSFQKAQMGINSSTAFGLSGEFDFNDNFSGSYNLLLGYADENAKLYVYTGWPQVLSGTFLGAGLAGGGSISGYLGVLLAATPESFYFNKPINDYNTLGIFISPYGYERYQLNPTTEFDKMITASSAIGIRIKHVSHNEIFIFSPSFKAKYIYGEYGGVGFQVGIDIRPTKKLFKRNRSSSEDETY